MPEWFSYVFKKRSELGVVTLEKATSSMKPPHVTIECNGNYSEVVIGWT